VDDLQSEKEQIEEMRRWWSENGSYVIGGIVIGAGLLFGWNYRQSSQVEAQIEASALFETLAIHVGGGGDIDGADLIADQLAQDHSNSPYTAQSKLAMARFYMDKNRDQDAADSLGELLAMSGHDEIKGVGRLRLAKIMLYQDKAQDVIDLLDGQGGAAFAALYSDLMGDAYAAMGDYLAAEAAYQSVLVDATQGSVDRALVQMKLLDLPETIVAQSASQAADAETVDAADAAEPDTEAVTESNDGAEGTE
jgi:predicted negative regulator of RcsB-dependent stress response